MNTQNTPPLILLLGPTASGKTDLAIRWLERDGLPAEIISVDSAMVYRGLDIGSGKPSPAQLKRTPHHLIDIRNPDQPYSAAEFADDALELIQDIRARGRMPLLVGGTLLYFRALLQGLSPLPSADPKVRARLLEEAQSFGWKALHDRLSTVDPKAAAQIHPQDPQRIQRALEIYELSGQSRTQWFAEDRAARYQEKEAEEEEGEGERQSSSAQDNWSGLARLGPLHVVAILPKNRALLHQRIQERFYAMLEQGFMEEARALYRNLVSGEWRADLPALRAVGYRQALQHLAGEYAYEDMIQKAIAATRQLAKRQMTWLRGLFKPASLEILKARPECQSVHLLDIENNDLDSLKSMLHCSTDRSV